MTPSGFRRRTRMALRAAIACAAGALGAYVPAARAQAVPTASELLSRHEAAAGGRAALDAHSSLRMRGTVSLPANGMSGTIEVLRARPNRFVQRMRFDGLGDVAQGFDGSVAWDIQPSGASLLTGPDAESLRTRADWLSDFAAPVAFFRARVDSAEFDGQPTWRATFASDIGVEVHTHFSRATGLRVAEVYEHAVGETTSTYGAYKPFGGVTLATRITTRTPGGAMITVFDSVEFDRVDSAAVALPASVRVLIGR